MNKKTTTFQENIRNTFISYAIIPSLILVCLAMLLFYWSWNYSIIHYNRQDNEQITHTLEAIENTWSTEVSKLCDLAKDEPTQKITDIYEIIYAADRSNRCSSQVYLLDDKGALIWNVEDADMDFLLQPEYQQWGILRMIRQQPEMLSTYIQNDFLCMGQGILDENGKFLGYLVVGIPGRECADILSGINRKYAITDEMGWIYLSNSAEYLSDEMGRFLWFDKKQDGFFTENNQHFYLTQNHILSGQIGVYTMTDTDPKVHIMWWMILMIVVIFAIIGIVTYYSTRKVSAKYTQDVKLLADAFTSVENGEWNTNLAMDSTLEFQVIGKAFNKMIDSMRKQVEENKELALHAAFAQVKQLESQFNPHFLFNTLDNIRFMIHIDANSADKMITSLSKLLRYSIHDSGEEISVKEDMENIQSYFNILQIRYNKRFAYEVNIEESILDCMIPKLIMQPLVENAVKYGFTDRDKLTVKIKGYEKQGRLIFSCEDDGAGMTPQQLKDIRRRLQQKENKEGHLGLYNIHRRIQLMYGEEYGIFLESEIGQGVVVVLVLPVKR
jgi:two-component system sensor histidine kinase YesM